MTDLNNNGIDDALEIEHTRVVKNADGSSQADTIWKKMKPAGEQLPSTMQNGPSVSASGLFTVPSVTNGTSWKAPAYQPETNVVPAVIQGYTPDAAGREAQRNDEALRTNIAPPAGPYVDQPPQRQNVLSSGRVDRGISRQPSLDVQVAKGMTDLKNNMAARDAALVTGTRAFGNQLYSGQYAAFGTNPRTGKVDPSSVTTNLPMSNLAGRGMPTTDVNTKDIPVSPMNRLAALGTSKINVTPGATPWDKFNEDNRRARVAMGVGGINNAQSPEERQTMINAQMARTPDLRQQRTLTNAWNTAQKQIDVNTTTTENQAQADRNLIAQEAAGKMLTEQQKAQQAADLAKQNAINAGEAEVARINMGNGSINGLKPLIDETTGAIIPNVFRDAKGKIVHVPAGNTDMAALLANPAPTTSSGADGSSPQSKKPIDAKIQAMLQGLRPGDPRTAKVIQKLRAEGYNI